MSFIDCIRFCFQIYYSSVIPIQKNRCFGDKIKTNIKPACITHTGSSSRILYYLKRSKTMANSCYRDELSEKSRRQVRHDIEHILRKETE